MPTSLKADTESLFLAAAKATESGVVASTHQKHRRFWNHWVAFLHARWPGVTTDLQGLPFQEQMFILGAFAEYIRRGDYNGTKTRVKTGTVEVALGAITTTLQMDRKQSPVVTKEGHVYLPLARQLETYRRQDPPSKPKLALPVSALKHIRQQSQHSQSPKALAIADLIIIAWFYLLRVGEYTYSKPSQKKRTTPFKVRDVTLWHHQQRLPHNLPLHVLLVKCTAASLQLDNSKTGARNEVIHHTAIGTPICPVAALVRRVHHIRTHTTDDNALLGSYYPRPLHGRRHITYDDINKHLKHTAKAMNLQQYNIPPERISSHSLRAGGALALYLNGTPAMSIRLMGRWSSDTFLRYIHPQFSHFSQGFAQRMSKAIQLHNVSINPSIHNP